MSLAEDGDLCRVTVDGPQLRVDLALPAGVSFSELMPLILSYSGRDLAEAGLEHDGWVLQRLDETAIDESKTPAQVSLVHGDVLFLRPATRQLPELSAGAFGDRAGPEGAGASPDRFHAFAIGVTGGASAGVAAILSLGAFSWTVSAVIAAVFAALLCGLGTVASRFERTSGVGVACSLGALPLAFLAGFAATLPADGLAGTGPRHVLPGLAAVALLAVPGLVATGRWVPVFTAVAATALAGVVVTTALLVLPDLSVAAGTALVIIAVLTVQRIVRLGVLRIKGRLADIPPYLEETPQGGLTRTRSGWTERFLTGLEVSLGVIVVASAAILSFSGDRLGQAAGAGLALILATWARNARGDTGRPAFLTAGTAGVALAVAGSARGDSPGLAAASLAVLCAGAGVLVAVCLWRHDRQGAVRDGRRPSPSGIAQPSPLWNRVLTVAEVVLTLGAILLSLAMAGVFSGHAGL